MNDSPRLRAPLAALGLLACSLTARAQTSAPSSGDTVELPQFTVRSSAENRYRPEQSVSTTRVAGNLQETPFTVNVMPRELLDDLGANAMFDVTRYFSGTSPGRGTGSGGIQDRQNFRGFESFSKTIDNFSSFLLPTGNGFQANFDPVFVDRVELVMGPNSVLAPTGSPGGSINIISKSPQFQQGTDVGATVGNYNAQKLTLDTTGPIGASKHWAYRAIGSAQDTETYVPGRLKQYNGGLELEYDFTRGARFTTKYFGEQWGLYGAIANANQNGEAVYGANTIGGATISPTPTAGYTYRGWNGDANWSHRIDRVNIGEAEFTTPLGEHVNMRLGGQILYDNQIVDVGYPRVSPGETFDPQTGRSIAVTSLDPTALAMLAQHFHGMNRDIQFQNDFAGSFQSGGISVQPVVGWASQVGRSTGWTVNDTSAADLPAANLYAGEYTTPEPPLSHFTAFLNNIPQTGSQFQVYGVARLGFLNDRLFVTAGGSRMWASVQDYSLKGIYVPGVGQLGAAPDTPNYVSEYTFNHTGNSLAPTQKDYHDTYLGGVLLKATRNLAVYGSYSTNAGIAANNPLWQAGTQYEFGVKAEYFNKRLSITADHFQITQSNVSTPNPLFNIGQSPLISLLSNESSHGYEINVVGGLTRDLSVIASFTEMRLRDPLGRRVRNVPDTLANLLLNYRFHDGLLKGASVFAGVNHQGNVAGETVTSVSSAGVPNQPGFYLAPWTVVNAGASYTWRNVRFNLNVDNALNSKFWWQPAGRISVSPYPGPTVRLTTTFHF